MAFDTLPEFPREQRWRAQPYPAPIVVALIQRRQWKDAGETAVHTPPRDNHYLLINRRDQTYGGQWALVGGKWDFGETLQDAIRREVLEETGLDATFVALRGIVNERVLPHQPQENGAHFLIFVCELTAPNGDATEQNEGAVAWFTRPEIEALHAQQAIIPSDFAMLQQFAGQNAAMPFVEAEMRAPIGSENEAPIQLLRFERLDDPPPDS